ncbi:hypothetical protein FACS189426_22930 [Bacteroidia bacterium]|nr:hypothetical protein FACS189426_22930 [Bacteroidia bacterium]
MINGTEIEQNLQQIAEMLVLNGTLTECPGLVHGKMGIAVFFFHYAQHTSNELFADYAMDVIGEMLNQIHVNSPADYEKGLAGIGVGIDYLIRNNFLDVEDDICEDFDQRMVRAVMYDPWQDFSQYNGLTGYGRYWITRLRYPAPSVQARECLMRITALIEEKLLEISVEEQTDVYCFLHDLQEISGFEFCKSLLEQCRNWNLQSADMKGKMDMAFKQIPDLDMEKSPAGTGLLTGYAGEGMLRLTAINQTNRLWLNLL